MFDPVLLRTLIDEHGIVVTLKRYTNGIYDPVTGSVSQTQSSEQVKVYFFNNDPSIVENKSEETGERRVVVSDKTQAGADTPQIKGGDIISGFGDDVVVTRASKITSGASNMCQLLYVKE